MTLLNAGIAALCLIASLVETLKGSHGAGLAYAGFCIGYVGLTILYAGR